MIMLIWSSVRILLYFIISVHESMKIEYCLLKLKKDRRIIALFYSQIGNFLCIKESCWHQYHILCTWRAPSDTMHRRKKMASHTLCSAAGSWCFENIPISPGALLICPLYSDAGWHIYSICMALMTPCGCNSLISVFHLVKWSTAESLSTRRGVLALDLFIYFFDGLSEKRWLH